MSEPIAKQVLSIIETAPNDTIFASVDFSRLAIGDTIRKTLNRLEEQGVLVKLLPSIYKKRDFQDVSPESVAKAIARQNNWTIVPTSNFAKAKVFMHSMLIETFEFLSTGSSKKYDLREFKLVFTQSDLSHYEGMSEITVCVLETLKNLTKKGCTQKALQKLSSILTPQDLDLILAQTKSVEPWIVKCLQSLTQLVVEAKAKVLVEDEDTALKKKLATPGTDNFANLFNEFEPQYYVDKTKYIKEVLTDPSDVMLFTRPSLFGKTLFLTSLKSFCQPNFQDLNDLKEHQRIFKALDIYQDTEFCKSFMGKTPCIYLSLNDAFTGNTYESALKQFVTVLCMQLSVPFGAIDCNKLSLQYQEFVRTIKDVATLTSLNIMSYTSALEDLAIKLIFNACAILKFYFKQKLLLLIDAYDAPLSKISGKEYFHKLSALYATALQTVINNHEVVFKTILAGQVVLPYNMLFASCNNLKSFSVISPKYSELFGFTDDEIDEMLQYYNLRLKALKFKSFYGAYNFNGKEIYNPWDVISFIQDLRKDQTADPRSFWCDQNNLEIFLKLFSMQPYDYVDKLSELLLGKSIEVELSHGINYPLFCKRNNSNDFWTLLLMKGYLTLENLNSQGIAKLRIVNKSTKLCFSKLIKKFTSLNNADFRKSMHDLLVSLKEGQTKAVNYQISKALLGYFKLVALDDNFDNLPCHYLFMHQRLSSYINSKTNMYQSFDGTKDGRCGAQFLVVDEQDFANSTGVILEFVEAKSSVELNKIAEDGLIQIKNQKYAENFLDEVPFLSKVQAYAISFFEDRSCVKHQEFLNQN